jgi:hypothetical protein
MNLPLLSFARWLTLVALSIALIAPAWGTDLVNHSFAFDLTKDDQDAAILDYRYGLSKNPVQAPEWAVKEGKEMFGQGVTGPMLRPDFLYVKWRNRATRQEYEDTVDLRQRLPQNFSDHTVYLMIRGAQLYLYLIPPNDQKRPKGVPFIGPRMYSDLNTIMIYPDQTKK